MKILMVADSFGDAYSANIKIGCLLADALSRRGVTCHFLAPEGERESFSKLPSVVFHPYTLSAAAHRRAYYDPHVQDHFAKVKDKPAAAVLKLLVLLGHPIRTFKMLRSGAFSRKAGQEPDLLAESYRDNILRVQRRVRCDLIIGIYMPAEVLRAFGQKAYPVPVFLYQLDPWALHELPLAQSPETRANQEGAAFALADHIFTTPVLLSQYRDSAFAAYVNKMTAVEFPVLIKPQAAAPQGACDFPKSGINVLYAGSLTEEYRSPAFVIAAFSKLLERRGDIRLYFMGVIQSEALEAFGSRFPGQVFFLGPQSSEIAQAATEQADVLLNIGNGMKNQMPSKVIECIATGKPLISTTKHSDDPAGPLLARYPLSLLLQEWGDPEQAEGRLAAFLDTAVGKRIPFQDIERTFSDCTPDYVAGQMLEVAAEQCRMKLP